MSFNRTDSPERKNTLLIFIIPDSGTFVKAFAASIFAILLGMILRGEKMEPIMIVRNLYKIYHQGENEVRALDGVSLTVDKGEFVAIVGRSGSGKSTLMNVLGCLDTPTSGEYILDGENVGALSEDQLSSIRNREIGFIFQGFNLVPGLTANERRTTTKGGHCARDCGKATHHFGGRTHRQPRYEIRRGGHGYLTWIA